ncbi:MAG: alpha/beta fold hydrolase [Muribaculaceae bacterium]|nr:alpha/beta fold hydrolase [Muribaculaceae bacterium]
MRKITFIMTLLLALSSVMVNAQEGSWKGELDIQGTKLPLVFNFSDDGCTLDSPAQGVKNIKAEKSIAPEGKLKIAIPSLGAVYEGVIGQDAIIGTFTQSGFSFPLTLKPGKMQVKRPQTPVAPFPYTTEEVTFHDGEVVLHGTLTLPTNCTKDTPAVLMVTGSGQQDRDEELFDHRPFAVLADAFARQGIATLRYDDRGYNDPTFPFYDFTTYHFKCDAREGIHWLRNRFNKVGVLGHSEGGTIALMLACEGEVDFAISLAGMSVKGKETILKQNEVLFNSMGVPSDIIATYCNALDNGLDEIMKGTQAEQVALPEMPESLKDNLVKALKVSSTPYMLHFLTLDIRGDLAKIKCPVLALNGTKDTQVDCATNLDAIDKGLVNSKHKVVPVEGVNHLFQHCQTGVPTEYQLIEETFANEAIKCILEWIDTNCRK